MFGIPQKKKQRSSQSLLLAYQPILVCYGIIYIFVEEEKKNHNKNLRGQFTQIFVWALLFLYVRIVIRILYSVDGRKYYVHNTNFSEVMVFLICSMMSNIFAYQCLANIIPFVIWTVRGNIIMLVYEVHSDNDIT